MAKETLKDLKERIEGLTRTNLELQDDIIKLQKEKGSVGMVLMSELVAEISRTKQAIFRAEQSERNLEHEKKLRIRLEERFKNEKENKTVDSATTQHLEARIKELEAKLSRNNAGRPKNKHTDQEIIDLRKQGKTIRAICEETGMSSATVVKILKGFKDEL